MKKYKFHKNKYGEELLIDIVTIDSIRKFINKDPVHTLTYFDITIITNGSGYFMLDNEEYTLAQGDVIFSKPGDIRKWDTVNIPQGYALIFEEEFLLSFFNDPSFIQNLAYFNTRRVSAKINIDSISVRINHLLQSILSEINNEESKDKHILRAMLYEILMVLNREYLRANVASALEEKPQNRYVDRFITLVDTHFSIHHNTSFYADELCITPNYLNEIIQKCMGVSSKSYILNKIMQEAKKMLSYSDLSVSEIADSLHFENPSYFIRLFRQQTGFTPLQYRQGNYR